MWGINPTSIELAQVERWVIILALINACLFYAITLGIFLVSKRSPLNNALAAQKLFWLSVIGLIAIPAYWLRHPILPSGLRVFLWVGLSLCTWWVFREVYRVNWKGRYSLRYWLKCRKLWLSRQLRRKSKIDCSIKLPTDVD